MKTVKNLIGAVALLTTVHGGALASQMSADKAADLVKKTFGSPFFKKTCSPEYGVINGNGIKVLLDNGYGVLVAKNLERLTGCRFADNISNIDKSDLQNFRINLQKSCQASAALRFPEKDHFCLPYDTSPVNPSEILSQPLSLENLMSLFTHDGKFPDKHNSIRSSLSKINPAVYSVTFFLTVRDCAFLGFSAANGIQIIGNVNPSYYNDFLNVLYYLHKEYSGKTSFAILAETFSKINPALYKEYVAINKIGNINDRMSKLDVFFKKNINLKKA